MGGGSSPSQGHIARLFPALRAEPKPGLPLDTLPLPVTAQPQRCCGGAANPSAQDPLLPIPPRVGHGDHPQTQCLAGR